MSSSRPAPNDSSITILDFWAEWCGICRLIDPVVQRVVGEHDDVALEKIDVGQDQAAADRHQVKGLPTLVFVSTDGQELNRLTGTITGKQIEAALAECDGRLPERPATEAG